MSFNEEFDHLIQANPHLIAHCELMLGSYQKLLGKPLVAANTLERSGLAGLFNAPFALLSHNTQTPPVFNYGNQLALNLFERSWEAFTQLPSRQSAEADERSERERLLQLVNQQGYIEDYRGVRISATGKRFYIDQTTVWNLVDDAGVYQGQAAAIFHWEPLCP